MAKIISRDINSSVHLLNFICNPEDCEKTEKLIRVQIKKMISQSKIQQLNINNLRAYDNGRVPTKSQAKNPIIVAQYKRKRIILDGNHRVLLARRKKIVKLKAVVLNLSTDDIFSYILDYD